VPVPKNIQTYRRMARKTGKVWMVRRWRLRCVGDDVKPGKLTSFPQAVMLEPDETVVFSWIVYKSRAHRDKVNARVMADPRLADMESRVMPFDGKRMFWGFRKSSRLSKGRPHAVHDPGESHGRQQASKIPQLFARWRG
jgi:uncharacterized protein YbaA (DUF1428 family)